MLNSRFVGKQAEDLARRIALQTKDEELRIANAYNVVFGRRPTAAELVLTRDFLRQQTQRHAPQKKKSKEKHGFATNNGALIDLCLVLLNSAEFLYVD
jgi:hypothetical protein